LRNGLTIEVRMY